MYNLSKNDFTFVDKLELANIIILPMSWNYYLLNGLYNNVERFVKEKDDFKILSWISGDFTVKAPDSKNLFIIHESGYKSKLSLKYFCKPVFINDPLYSIFRTSNIIPIKFSKTPIVGFCGQSNHSYLNAFKECFRVFTRNFLYFLNFSHNFPHKVMSSSLLRSKILKIIKKSKLIDDNFIERKKYRAGAIEQTNIKITTNEFYNNIIESHYVICCRGGGNFSVRLYETLAMGRIPIFINTDCLLPYHSELRDHALWIEDYNLKNLESSIIKFHLKFNENSFQEFLNNARAFWLKKMSMKFYFSYLFGQINKFDN